MKKTILILLPVLISVCFATGYGRNKVQIGAQEWWEIQGRHFTIYFPQGGEIPAETLLVHTERELLDLSEEFNYMPEDPIPIVLYISPGTFRQTDINPYEISQAVGGFTEFYKSRIVVPFTGYWSEFRHLIAHELSHAFIYDMLYKRSLLNIISGGTPLWMMEGLAEYTSIGWDTASEAEFRDMVISNQIVSIDVLSRRSDYLVYREGQAIYHFINERYGEEKFREFVQHLNSRGSRAYSSDSDGSSNGGRRAGDPFNAVFGMSSSQFSEKFLEWARETYWSELACGESPSDIANAIYEDDDERVRQMNSVVSDDGRLIAGIEYHHARMAVCVRSAVSGELEYRPFISGGLQDVSISPMYRTCSFSPTADSIVIAVQYIGGDQLIICHDGKQENLPVELDLIRDPIWSPSGRYIGFAGMEGGQLNIYSWDLQEHVLTQINDDISGERDLSWKDDRILCVAELIDGMTEIIEYGLDGTSNVLLADSSDLRYPISVSDGILFMSNMNGYPDLYLLQDSSGAIVRLTSLYRTIESPSWASSSDVLTFVSSDWSGYGVFLAYDITERRVQECEHGFYSISDDGPNRSITREYYMIEDSTLIPEPDDRPHSRELVPTSDIIHEAVQPGEITSSAVIDDEFQCSISPYTPRLTIDYASANAAYDSYLGIAGYTQFILSDILAHHQIVVNTNLNGGSLSDVDVAVFYGYLPHRTDFGFALMRESYRYLFKFEDGHHEEVRDVDIGGFTLARYPISPSLRVSAALGYRHLGRTGTWNSTADFDEDIVSVQTGVVFDNALWGSVGPRVGSRLSLVGEFAPSISGSANYGTFLFDLRNYLWVTQRVTFATRLAGGGSWGPDAQYFYLGGAMPQRLLWGEVDSIDELLGFYTNYGDMLRGYDYASIRGRKYALFSMELRVPFVNTLALDAPLPMVFTNGRGVLYCDIGCAFDDFSSFHGASTSGRFHLDDLKMGLGLGYRFNLGFFLLKHDITWRTDLHGFSRKPVHNITIGAEF